MKHSLTLMVCVACCIQCATTFAADPAIADSYDNERLNHRRATRGDWTFQDQIASCTQDDELYKKYKNHGPVIWYDSDFDDATIAFSLMPDPNVKTFVFTINGNDGHIFRYILRAQNSIIKVFPPQEQGNGILTREAPALVPGEWQHSTVVFKGDSVTVTIGDYEFKTSHPSLTKPKTTIGLGFSFGTLKLKDFSVK